MQGLLGLVAAGALLSMTALSGSALASTTFTDVTPATNVCISTAAPTGCGGSSALGSTTFTMDITDSGFVPGSTITFAELTLTLVDDGGAADSGEKLDLTVDGTVVQHNANANHDAVVTFADYTSLSDGKLVVVLGATDGDFFFNGATLTVVDDPPTTGSDQTGTVGSNEQAAAAAVPAPAALMVLGTGLVAMGWRRRAAR
jgi:PEP-CTERM motif-containing protein